MPAEADYDDVVLLVPGLGKPELVGGCGGQRFASAAGESGGGHGAGDEGTGRFQEIATVKGMGLRCFHGSSSLLRNGSAVGASRSMP